MHHLRSWYHGLDNEPLRREVAWFSGWMHRRGWIWLIPIILLSHTEFLIFTERLPLFQWLSNYLNSPFNATLAIDAAEPGTLLTWIVWFFLLRRRALPFLQHDRLRELTLTHIRFRDLSLSLLATPALWIGWVSAVRALVNVIEVVVFPQIFVRLEFINLGIYMLVDVANETLNAVVLFILGLGVTAFVLLKVLRNPTPIWTFARAVQITFLYWLLFQTPTEYIITQRLTNLYYPDYFGHPVRQNPDIAVSFAASIISITAVQFVLVALFTRHYVLKFRIDPTSDRLRDAYRKIS